MRDLPAKTGKEASVRLRAPEMRDRPALLRWRGDTHTQVDLMLRVTHTDSAEVESWIARRTGDPDGDFRLIAAAGDDRAIGFVQLVRIDRSAKRAWLGLFVDPSARGTGAAAEALALMEREARDVHGLREIRLEVLGTNKRALKFWEKRGYFRTEVARDHYTRNNKRYDVVFFEKQIRPVG
jgi:RimJ/RimL family protein N-acetyltransferase